MRYAPRALLAGGLGFAVSILVAACGGGGGLLSGDQSNTLNSQLDQVSNALDGGQCAAAASAVGAFGNSVGNLPATVDPKLRANLAQGASTLAQLTPQDCHTSSTTTSSTSTTSSSTTTTSTTTTSTPTSTTSTPTSTTTSTPTSTTTSTATTTTGSGTSSTGGTSGGAGLGSGNSGSGAAAGNGQ